MMKNPRSQKWRAGIIAIAVFLFFIALLVYVAQAVKMHYHIPYTDADGKTKFHHIWRNLSAVETFSYAQGHDLAGEPELATEDYRAAIQHRQFKDLPDKVKPVLMELLDCREQLDPHDYFAELVTHSRISYWSQAQMPLRIYVPAASKKDGFSDFDRKEIQRCFDEWCAIVPDRVSYKMVDDPEHGDILFSQKKHSIDLSFSRSVLAHTIPMPGGPENWAVFPAMRATIEPLVVPGPEIKDTSDKRAALRHTVFMHEIGHALGIIGHSCHANDLMFFSGSGVLSERDKETFRKIYGPGSVYERSEKAMRDLAKKKDKYALVQLALQLEENGTASPQKLVEVFDVAKRAAELGSNKAMLMLGWMYHDGNGVRRDLNNAIRWFHEAARKGNAGSLLALASAYERGDGDKQNLDYAERYLKMAMRMDLSRAPVAYGNFLSYQFGDKDSIDRAAIFYKKTASKEHIEALMRLALIYEHGQGVEKDPVEAEKLKQKAKKLLAKIEAKNAAEYFARGCAWSEVAEPEKAIADLDEAIKLKPTFRAGYMARGSAEQNCGRSEAALADMSRALELDPNCIQAYLGRSYSYLGLCKPKEALADVKAILDRTNSPDSDRLYAQILGSVACRMLKDEAGAKEMIDSAFAGTSPHVWPGPIVRYLRHDLSDADFEKEALGYSRATEVRFYLAMEQSISGKTGDAIKNLRWIKENGDKTFYEYPVAIAFLDRIPKTSNESSATRSVPASLSLNP